MTKITPQRLRKLLLHLSGRRRRGRGQRDRGRCPGERLCHREAPDRSTFRRRTRYRGRLGGSGDAFLTKLTRLARRSCTPPISAAAPTIPATGIALDAAGNAYIVGTTFSTNFPTANPFQSAKGAQQDAFVAKINPAGTAWVYSTYLGGNNVDEGNGIAVDATGNAYVTGYTASTNFPLHSPFRGSNTASVDAFVTKLNPAGSALVYSTYLGGSGYGLWDGDCGGLVGQRLCHGHRGV